MLCQEMQLRQAPVAKVPPVSYPQAKRWWRGIWLKPLAYGIGCLLAGVVLWHTMIPNSATVAPPMFKPHRFVIYRPDISRVEISGSFTGWQPRKMRRIGETGYWETELNLPSGEHRFVYILEGQQHMADPTVQDREKDGFGGENSILSVSL